jgi:AraC family transcriptional regulator
MVCDRCVMAVKQELEKSRLDYEQIELGEVSLKEEPSSEQLAQFKKGISDIGFELIEDKTARTISAIKNAVLEFVRTDSSANRKLKFSVYLSEKINKDYNHLSALFSAVEGTTIEHHLILQKIERVKELLVYDELSLSEISHTMGYSSVQHLSTQFKKVTGLTPSHFKQIKEHKRKPLDHV